MLSWWVCKDYPRVIYKNKSFYIRKCPTEKGILPFFIPSPLFLFINHMIYIYKKVSLPLKNASNVCENTFYKILPENLTF